MYLVHVDPGIVELVYKPKYYHQHSTIAQK